jgi:hypothetical protein
VSWPAPTRQDHLRFVEAEGWTLVRSSKGKTGTHHDTYELWLDIGDTLRTRISRPPDRTGYGKNIWSHILRDQLGVTEAEFWACVQDGQLPDRGVSPEPEREAIPTGLLWQLINKVGVPEDEVAAMTKEEAIERLNLFWATGR